MLIAFSDGTIVPEFLLQAKKTGREPSPNDAVELERVTQEQAVLQKQLDSLRKQVKQHQMQTQDYRTKKRVSRGPEWRQKEGKEGQRGAKKRVRRGQRGAKKRVRRGQRGAKKRVRRGQRGAKKRIKGQGLAQNKD